MNAPQSKSDIFLPMPAAMAPRVGLAKLGVPVLAGRRHAERDADHARNSGHAVHEPAILNDEARAEVGVVVASVCALLCGHVVIAGGVGKAIILAQKSPRDAGFVHCWVLCGSIRYSQKNAMIGGGFMYVVQNPVDGDVRRRQSSQPSRQMPSAFTPGQRAMSFGSVIAAPSS